MRFGNFYSNRLSLRIFAVITLSVLLLVVIISGCSLFDSPPRFEKMSSEKTAVKFSNDLEYTPEFNMLNYMYFYDGGGVSIGDVNNDGLPDLYFTGNMNSNKLYLNKGDFEFKDITDQAGVGGKGDWTTGTTMADVNGDGLLDIYICNVNYLGMQGRNQLYINNGDSTFTERAAEYGLDFSGYSKQAAFFDYDNDGDLDMYLLNHSIHSRASFADIEWDVSERDAGDRLYRNDGDYFTDVTEKAGIKSTNLGYGLGIGISDLNRDGCPDMYVSNDFHEDDYLYLNNCDGTFSDIMEQAMGHTSRASMGNDIADLNNDGLTDIYVVDMLPETEVGKKTSISSEPYHIYAIQREQGYHPQLIRNTLQVNLGTTPEGQLKFAEIAPMYGLDATDWSWATLLFDMNNDGHKDIFVTNGIYRRPNDLDYLLYSQKATSNGSNQIDKQQIIEEMPHTKTKNVGFMNRVNNRFSAERALLGFADPSYSSGAAYGDLDNDGDLDLVVNNVNSEPAIYKNRTRERGECHYLKIKLTGNTPNTSGIGSKVMVYDSAATQYYELFTTRGFQSSVEPVLTIGVGNAQKIDSLTVKWPDQQLQTLRNIKVNQELELKQFDAGKGNSTRKKPETIFRDVTDQISLDYSHQEDPFIDFEHQQLAPFSLTSQGPCLATGDVNGDGLEDFFICGAKGQPGTVFLQQQDGKFEHQEQVALEQDAGFEDVDALLYDANGDGYLDLYVVSGGNQYPRRSQMLSDRLYVNDGTGSLVRNQNALPDIYENGGTVAAADYDGDGDQDLFIGNRSVPQNYGVTPESYLLENKGKGVYKDVTDMVAPELRKTGMVTEARWSDINGDGAPDLSVVGEWMPISIFINQNGTLNNATVAAGLSETLGLWQHVETVDIDDDGDLDLLVGNMGANSYMKATSDEPVVLYLKDFNVDAQVDPVLGYTKGGREYPVVSRDIMLRSFKFLRSSYESYESYAGETIQDIFGASLTEGAWQKKRVFTSKSVVLENIGEGNFKIISLPEKAQWAPIFASLNGDFNGTGHMDILAGGNLYDVQPSVGGRHDASYGWFLEGKGEGSFEVLGMQESGFFVEGEIRDIDHLTLADGRPLIIIARNNRSPLFFTLSEDRTEAHLQQ